MTFFILAKSASREDVYDAVFTYMATFDSIADAVKYGLDSPTHPTPYHAVVQLTIDDAGNIISDDDIKVVYED